MHQACNFIKKETLAQVFSCEFCEISKNTLSTEHLLLSVASDLIEIRDLEGRNLPSKSLTEMSDIDDSYSDND